MKSGNRTEERRGAADEVMFWMILQSSERKVISAALHTATLEPRGHGVILHSPSLNCVEYQTVWFEYLVDYT